MHEARDSESVPAGATRPAGFRDPWTWAVLLAAVPLLLKCAGTPAGEPVAEDFDFLRHALLTDQRSLLDGGGSLSFWRPLAHQLYYLTLGPLVLSAPGVVAAIHAAFLAGGALLLYRALRGSWSGPAAAAAAAFPLLAESTRTLVAWPTQFVDVGLYFFSVLALHERAAGRLPTALAALAAALLCKEVAIVTGVLLAFWPGASGRSHSRWLIGAGAVLVAWAIAFVWVRQHAGLTLPHGLESDARLLATPIPQRLWWAVGSSSRAIMSLALRPDRWDLVAALGAVAITGAAVLAFAGRAAARARMRAALPWTLWGLAWFALASAAVAAIFPIWQPNRSHFGSVGLAIAAVATLQAAAPALVGALVALRLALLLLAPGAVTTIEQDPPDRGAFMDFQRLSRLQRLMREIRTALRERYPSLPHGTSFVQHNLPRAAEYALGGSHALQVWYRDTTLSWVRFADFKRGRGPEPTAMVAFEPLRRRQISFVEPGAARALLEAVAFSEAQRYSEALVWVARAESALTDTNARVIRSSAAAVRAMALAGTGRLPEAEAEAERSVRLYPRNSDANFLLGLFRFSRGRLAEAEAHLDVAIAAMPGDSLMLATRERVRAARRSAPR